MNEKKAAERVAELISEINFHNKRYYELDNPIIDDETYDKLLKELMNLEDEFPKLASQMCKDAVF